MLLSFTSVWERYRCPPACILHGVFMELKKPLYLIFIGRKVYLPSPLLPLISMKETIYLSFLLLILMKTNTYVKVGIPKFCITPFFLGLAANLSCSHSPRVDSTRKASRQSWPTATQGSSADPHARGTAIPYASAQINLPWIILSIKAVYWDTAFTLVSVIKHKI